MRPLRLLPLFAVAMLAGCSATPASLGLTGRGPVPPPPSPSDADLGIPGVREGSDVYTPSLVPHTGAGRYFGSD